MPSIQTVIERWLDTLECRTDSRGRRMENLSGARVFGHWDTLYSYGRHFPLAEYHEPRRSREGKLGRPLFLLNGDRVSVSTSRHQREAREAIQRRAWPHGSANPVADVLILPFSALDGAGIDRSTIVPLEIRGDRWETLAEIPCPVDLDDPSTATESVRTTTTRYGPSGPEPYDYTIHRWRHSGYLFQRSEYDDSGLADYVDVVEWPQGEPRELAGHPGNRTLVTRRHLLGDSLFTAIVPERREILRPVTVRDVVLAARWNELEQVDPEEGIRETITLRPRRRYVSSFDANEPAPLYFLATLPRSSRARTVAAAIDDLAPPAVHAALARGLHVDRQGDIFAIETRLTDDDLQGMPRARLTQWTRDAKPREGELGYSAPLTAHERRQVIADARKMWRREWAIPGRVAPSTPKGTRADAKRRRTNAERSLETNRNGARRVVLAPFAADYRYSRVGDRAARARESVEWAKRVLAEARQYRGTMRDRYRDMSSLYKQKFALELWEHCKREALYKRRPNLRPANLDRYRRSLRAQLSIHETAHSATEVVKAPGGRVYIRGAMIHAPGLEPGARFGRTRDHVKRELKRGTWYLAVRNTVPRANVDTNGRR